MPKRIYDSVVVVGCELTALLAARELATHFGRVTLIEFTFSPCNHAPDASALMADLRTHPQVRFVRAQQTASVLLNPSGTSAVGVAFSNSNTREPSAVVADLVVESRPVFSGGRPVERLLRLPNSSTATPQAVAAVLRACLAEQVQAHRNGSLEGVVKRFEMHLKLHDISRLA
jgi:hypothetical protein